MILTQHYLACLSHASYLIGDQTTGRAVVVDPRRDVGIYLEEAVERGLRIERVIETHVHADFLSGHLELAASTGAVISYGAGADVGFPIEPLHDGQRLSLGEVTLEILATPGHTPESICVVVCEHPDARAPLRGADRRHAVRRRCRPSRSAGLGRARTSAASLARQLYHSLHGKLLRPCPTPRASSPLTARARRAAGAFDGRRARRSASSGGRTTPLPWVTMSLRRCRHRGPARPTAATSSSTRGATASARPLLDEHTPAQLGRRRRSVQAACRRRFSWTPASPPTSPSPIGGAVNVGLQGRFAEWAGAVLLRGQRYRFGRRPAIAVEAKLRLARVGLDRVVPASCRPRVRVRCQARLGREQARGSPSGNSPSFKGSNQTCSLSTFAVPARRRAGTIPGARRDPAGRASPTRWTDSTDSGPVRVLRQRLPLQVAASVLPAAGFRTCPTCSAATAPGRGPGCRWRCREARVRRLRPRSVPGGEVAGRGSCLLDVREPGEWQAATHPGLLLPMGQVLERAAASSPVAQRIIVVVPLRRPLAAVTGSLRT